MQHIPYGGGSPATMAVLRGEVQMLLAGSLAVLPLIQSGGLKPLAIAAETRARRAARRADLSRAGHRLSHRHLVRAAGAGEDAARDRRTAQPRDRTPRLRSDAVRARIAEQGADVVGGSPDDFATFLRDETERLSAVIRRANIQLD